MAGGAEIGSAHVSIFPVMTGFKSAVDKELQSSGKSGAGLFAKAFNGKKIGTEVGKDVSTAFDSQTDTMGDAGFRKLTQQASQAAAQLAKARQTQSTAAAQAEAAEIKLADAISKYGSDSAQAVSAQAKLAAAQEKSEAATESLTQATDRLATARKNVLDVAASSGDSGIQWLQKETESATTSLTLAKQKLEAANESVARSEQRLADAISQSGTDSQQAARAQAQLVSAKGRQQRASQQAADAEDRLTQAQKQLESATKQANNELEKDSGGIFAKGLEKAKSAVDGFKEKLSGIGDDITSALGSNLTSALGVAAIGATIASVLGDAINAGVQAGVEQIDLTGTLQAKLGDTEMASQAAQTAGAVYAAGWGESLSAVGDDVALLMQQLGNLDESADFTTLTQQAIALGDTFDQDVGGMATAAGQMIKTGMVDNAQQAFDVLTVGFQSGANMADDLLDTFTEYPAQFQKLGLDGQTAMGLISQGLQNGARNADLVADAIKEFSIRAVDGSETTIAGFEALGLNADEMAAKFGQGGDVAAQAFDLVLDKLNGIEDPVERSAAAVNLFGTQAEDLGNALYALDPTTAVQALGEIDGAAQRATESSASITQSFESIKRSMMQGLGEAFQPAIQGAASALQSAMPMIQTVVDGISSVVGGLVTSFGTIFTAIGEQLSSGPLGTIFTNLSTMFTAIGATVMPVLTQIGTLLGTVIASALNLIAPIVASISGYISTLTSAVLPPLSALLTAIIPVITNVVSVVTSAVMPVMQSLSGVIQGVTQVIQGVIDFLVGVFTGNWQQAWTGIQTIASGVWNAISSLISTVINAIAGIIQSVLGTIQTIWNSIWGAIKSFVSNIWDGIKSVASSAINGVSSTISSVINGIKSTWTNIWNSVKSFFSSTWDSIKSTASNAINSLASKISGIKDTVMNAVSGAGQWLVSTGRNIINGLWNGISGAIGGLYSNIKNALSGLVDKAKSALGIHSPSRVFRDEVGQRIPEGIAVGIDNGSTTAVRSVQRLADEMAAQPFAVQTTTAGIATAGSIGRSAAASASLTADDIVAAIIKAVSIIGALRLDVDADTLAWALTPAINRELGRLEAMS